MANSLIGGSDTVSPTSGRDETHLKFTKQAVAALTIFFYLMIKHPEVQVKAQAEIDALTQGEYLPTWPDRVKLPYVEAVMLECLRWGPIGEFEFKRGADCLHDYLSLAPLGKFTVKINYEARALAKVSFLLNLDLRHVAVSKTTAIPINRTCVIAITR